MHGLNDEGRDWSTSQSVYPNVYPSVYLNRVSTRVSTERLSMSYPEDGRSIWWGGPPPKENKLILIGRMQVESMSFLAIYESRDVIQPMSEYV